MFFFFIGCFLLWVCFMLSNYDGVGFMVVVLFFLKLLMLSFSSTVLSMCFLGVLWYVSFSSSSYFVFFLLNLLVLSFWLIVLFCVCKVEFMFVF